MHSNHQVKLRGRCIRGCVATLKPVHNGPTGMTCLMNYIGNECPLAHQQDSSTISLSFRWLPLKKIPSLAESTLWQPLRGHLHTYASFIGTKLALIPHFGKVNDFLKLYIIVTLTLTFTRMFKIAQSTDVTCLM